MIVSILVKVNRTVEVDVEVDVEEERIAVADC
jgi:hypothetical protein